MSFTSLTSDGVKNRIGNDILETRKRKNQMLDTSQQQCSKRQKTCTSSTESLNEDVLSNEGRVSKVFLSLTINYASFCKYTVYERPQFCSCVLYIEF